MTPERPFRLAALTASPVFYVVPLYREIARDPRVELTVLYSSTAGVRPYDAGFGGRSVVWNEDLLSGYRSVTARAAEGNDVLGGFFALRDWDLAWRVLRDGYDAVWLHGLSYLTNWLVLAACALRRTPVLVREEQTVLHDRPWPKSWLRALVLRVVFSRAHGLYIGANNQAYFRRFGMPESRLHFTPYSVDNLRLQHDARELQARRDELRETFGIGPDDGPIVLFVGKLQAKKQPLVALDAFAAVRQRRRCALLIVGEGELEDELCAAVAATATPDVHLAGFLNRDEIATAYAAADVFLLPSALHETWGIVVNEALNFGLPAVLSDKVGSAADLVEPDGNGWIVRHDDTAGFADALDRLIADAELRARFGARSREIIARWTPACAAAGVVEACTAAARRRARLRVSFLPLLPPANAATRAFCERPIPFLAQRGIAGRLLPPSGNGAYRLLVRRGSRLRLPLAALYWYGCVAPRRIVQVAQVLGEDVVFIQRGLFRWGSPPLLEGVLRWIASRRGCPRIVYHVDDALHASGNARYYAARFRWADWVVTGNAEIASFARRHNPHVFDLPGAVAVERYPRRRRIASGPVVLGWVGHAPEEHLRPIVAALARVTRERDAVVKVVGDVPFESVELAGRLEFELWRPEREFAIFSEFDVGLMPLADTPFNRGKEGFKLKEYMASAIPVICSPVGHNVTLVEHEVTGLLAATEEEWVESLCRLCDDPELRVRLGAAGRLSVEKRFGLAAQAERFADFLLSLDETASGSTAASKEAGWRQSA